MKAQLPVSSSATRQLMVDAAKRGAAKAGFLLERLPGRGLSNVWMASKGKKALRVSIRTTQNRWIAFPPLEGGRRWKTLDDVDLVVVAAVNDKDNPQRIQVYIFGAPDLRTRFGRAYEVRKKAGQSIADDFGMWINLDKDERNLPVSAGSGIAEEYKVVAEYPVEGLSRENAEGGLDVVQGEQGAARAPRTIAEIMTDARARIAKIADVEVESVKLELKIEY